MTIKVSPLSSKGTAVCENGEDAMHPTGGEVPIGGTGQGGGGEGGQGSVGSQGEIFTGQRVEGNWPCDAEVITEDDEDSAIADNFCWGLCCFKGCLLGTLGLTYFFVVLPAGILLVFHGLNNGVSSTLGAGAAVLVVPTCLLPSLILAYKWRHHKVKDKRRADRARKKGYENPDPELDDEL